MKEPAQDNIQMTNQNIKRLGFVFIFLISGFTCLAQNSDRFLISGIILDADSIPLPDVAVINVRTGKTVRTNSDGFFETTIAEEDSLLAYHIAYKRLFISYRDNAKIFVLVPETHELLQVEVTEDSEAAQKKADKLSEEIMRVAPLKKLEGYDHKSRSDYFYEENSSHNKAFSPYFGPTVRISPGKLGAGISKLSKKRQLKKLTSHYHLIKKKKQTGN
jgi:hypothetical protein